MHPDEASEHRADKQVDDDVEAHKKAAREPAEADDVEAHKKTARKPAEADDVETHMKARP